MNKEYAATVAAKLAMDEIVNKAAAAKGIQTPNHSDPEAYMTLFLWFVGEHPHEADDILLCCAIETGALADEESRPIDGTSEA
jgi:hypothetical protein